MRTKISLAAACLACICVMGCQSSSTTTASKEPAAKVMAGGEMCPFSHHAANPKFTSEYHGKTVGFCCGVCKAKFDAMSDADKAKLCAK